MYKVERDQGRDPELVAFIHMYLYMSLHTCIHIDTHVRWEVIVLPCAYRCTLPHISYVL